MRVAIVGALVCFVAGAALAKQEQVRPERPTVDAQHEAAHCQSYRVEWWVKTPDGRVKLVGSQVVTRCE